MVAAGILGIIVVDDWKAKLWEGLLKNLHVHDSIKGGDGGRDGWAFREKSPELAAVVNDYLAAARNRCRSRRAWRPTRNASRP